MLSPRYPTIFEFDGVIADVPHDGYAAALMDSFAQPAITLGAGSSEAAGGFIRGARAHWRDAGFGIWFLRDLDRGDFAGWAGLRRCEADGERTVEFAYALAPRLRCKGHAARIGECAVRLGFENLGLAEIVASAEASDMHALPVLERLGFAFDRSYERAGRRRSLYRRKAAARASS